MKKAVNLLIIYILFFLMGLVLGTLLYSFYLSLLNFVAGEEIVFFSSESLFKSVFYVAYCLIFLICPLVSYYRIRHPGGLPQTIAYILICCITWGLLFPGVYKLNKFLDSRFSYEKEDETLSKGYFRQLGNRIYYFTDDFEQTESGAYKAPSVVINTAASSAVGFVDVEDNENFILNKAAAPYKEILIKNTFETSDVSYPVSFKILIQKAKDSFDLGFVQYLAFLSVGLVLASLYFMTAFFEWRLINASVLLVGTFLVLAVNSLYYMPVLTAVKSRINENMLVEYLSRYVENPLICVINILFAVLFIVLGVIKIAASHIKNKSGE